MPRPSRYGGDMDSAVRQKWRLGAELGARGLYGQAESVASELLADERISVRSLGAALVASHRRELGDYGCARFHDDQALRSWHRAGAPADWPYVDLLINRAADSIGLGELGDAEHWLSLADRFAEHGDARTTVRQGWVRADLALARQDPQGALQALDELDLPLARLRSPRHRIKTRLLRGVVLDRLGETGAAREELCRVLTAASKDGWGAIVWPAALALRRLETDPERRQSCLQTAREVIATIRLDLHPARAAAFLKTLPDELRTPAEQPLT